MKRTSLILTLASLLMVILTAPGQSNAQDTTGIGLVFVDCPDELTVDQNDSVYYRIVAAPVTTVKACPPIRYYLVSGPGQIDSLTGLWIFHPRFEEPPPEPQYDVEIAALFAGDTVLSAERCRFTVYVLWDSIPMYTVRIGYVPDQPLDSEVDIPVTLESIDPGNGLGGFSVTIGHDENVLTFVEALPGGLYSECGWEYFTFHQLPYDSILYWPVGVIEVAGIAEISGDGVFPSPDCQTTNPGYVGNVPVSLFTLTYLITDDIGRRPKFTPVRFFWYECTNNALTGFAGDELYLSSDVYDFGTDDPISDAVGVVFPTFYGAMEECLILATDSTRPAAFSRVDFYNGGVGLLGDDPECLPGDVNVNGIAYEQDDAVMFGDYFTHGLYAFEDHVAASIEATNSNCDSLTLTVEDYVHMVRTWQGIPVPDGPQPPSPNVATVSRNPETGVITVDTPDSLGALFMLFRGQLIGDCGPASGLGASCSWDDDYTRVFVSTFDPRKFISSGDLMTLEGDLELIEVETATYDARPVEVAIGPSPPARYAVKIGVDRGWDGAGVQYYSHAKLAVTIENADRTEGLGGFDLMMAYDHTAMRFLEADEGSLLQGCGWEYFTFRGIMPDSGTPSSEWARCQVVGIAETNNGADVHPNPDCQVNTPGWLDHVPDTLCHLTFRTLVDSTTECRFHPVRFHWQECKDNLLTSGYMSYAGPFLYGSADVYDHGSDEPINETIGVEYPTFLGAQEECIDLPTLPDVIAPMRNVDFFNGGVKFACLDDIDDIGDVNRNGIAYEIADMVMFSNYFVVDTVAFDGHVAQSTAASDVNGDGVPLTLEDLILLGRTAFGDRLPEDPPPPPSPNTAWFEHNPGTGVITVSTPDSLGAVFMEFRGESSIDFDTLTSFPAAVSYDGEYTRVFMWKWDIDTVTYFITAGDILTLPGELELLEVRTATYTGAKVNTEIGAPAASYTVRIGYRPDQLPGHFTTVPVVLESIDPEKGLGGFELLIEHDPAILSFQQALEGELYEECEWEYFTYRFHPYSNCSGCPAAMILIAGIAETNDGDTHPNPDCQTTNPGYVDLPPIDLFSMKYLVTSDETKLGQFTPVRFFWNVCTNNTLAGFSGEELYISSSVYDFGNDVPINETTGVELPTFFGSPEECLEFVAFPPQPPVRRVDFYNGGIGIVPPDTLYCEPGDLNLNSVPNEIPDAVMYTNYFIEGWSAFRGLDSACVVTSSDVNQDGVPLTVEDLILLIRIVVGDAVPYQSPASPTGTVTLFHDEVTNEVHATTTDTLGIIWMKFEGDIVPQPATGFAVDYGFDGTYTRMLVGPDESLALPSGGQLISYSGQGTLLEADAGDYEGRVLNVILGAPTDVDPSRTDGMPSDFALDNNYPNPFNPSTNIQYAVPHNSHVEIAIFNVAGQRVRTLVDAAKAVGTYTVTWDGTNEGGKRVSSGMYFYRMTAGDYVRSRKMILLK